MTTGQQFNERIAATGFLRRRFARKYTVIRRFKFDGEVGYSVYLKVNNQAFCVTPQAYDTRQAAVFIRDMLAIALKDLVAAEAMRQEKSKRR